MASEDETSRFDPEKVLGSHHAAQPLDSDASGERKATRDPLDIAVSHDWIDQGTAARLRDAASGDTAAAVRSAFEQGLITAREYDIIVALAGLRIVAPGYAVTDLLGQGGMGAVFLATQTALDRPVALKTILVDADSQSEAILRFSQEAKAVAKLRHPNVITAYDYGNHSGRFFLAMELVEGQDLNTRLADGPISETLAWHLARQVAAALAAAASEGIVHRDIKPANILLVEPPPGTALPDGIPMVKVADFGLSFLQDQQNVDRVTSANVAVGSPHYMAPELLSGQDASPASDMYALGATVYRCVSKEPPFSSKSLPAVISEKLSGHLPRAKGISDSGADLIAAMMATNAQDRPASFLKLVQQIDQLLETGTPAASPPKFSSLSKRTMWAQIAGMIVAVLATAAIVTAVAPRPNPAQQNATKPNKALSPESRSPDVGLVLKDDVHKHMKIETGRRVSLYDGGDLEGWMADTRFGDSKRWQTARGTEGEAELLGTAGRYFRTFAPILAELEEDGQRVEHFRLEAAFRRKEGARAGILFDLADDGPYYELQVSDGLAEVFAFDDAYSTGEFVQSAKLPRSPPDGNSSDVRSDVKIDFCNGDWLVEANGQQLKPLVARVQDGGRLSPRLGLSAPDGEVRFHDLNFVELAVEEDDQNPASSENVN